MKRIVVLLMLFLPVFVSAMKIEKDEIDEFTGKRTVITSWERCGNNGCIHIRFRLQGDTQWLDFKLKCSDAITINNGDDMLFKSTLGNIGTFKPIDSFYSLKNEDAGSLMWLIFATYTGDLSYFKNNEVKLMRVCFNNHIYNDYEISEKDSERLIKLYQIFNIAVNGKDALPEFQIIYQAKPKNATKWNVIDTKYREMLSEDELEVIRNEWEAKTDDKFDYRILIKRNKNQNNIDELWEIRC